MSAATTSRAGGDAGITNVILCGVGGQGTLLASNVLAETAMQAGFDVKKSEVHGMAQRGGSVVSHVRFGKAVASPLVRRGAAQLLLAFEELEALRWSPFLAAGGRVLVNRQRILPMSVSAGTSKYPDDVLECLRRVPAEVTAVDAIGCASGLGNPKCLNVVLLGVLARTMPALPRPLWEETLRRRLAPKLIDLNLKAFAAGWELQSV